MLTLQEASNILTEIWILADPATLTQWIQEGLIRAEHSESVSDEWLVSEEALRRLIRRHMKNWREQNRFLQQELTSLKNENERLKLQLESEIQKRKDFHSKLQAIKLQPGELPF